ncbi:MAG: autotransporter-associated beta strand repeat-containing protein, partial [Rariglobus sp.]
IGGTNSLLVGGGGSGGSVTLVNAGTYSGGTTVTGAIGGSAGAGTVAGAALLQTNILAGTSTTPFGSNPSIILNNGALGLGTAGVLSGGQAVNVTGYDITYNGQNAINLSAGGGSVALAANTLNRVNKGVLLLNPTSGTTLGNTEKVTVTSGAPVVTNGMVAPHYINATTRNFLTYDAVNGFKDITYSITGATPSILATASATDTVFINGANLNSTLGGNKVIHALKLLNSSTFNANAIGSAGETLTLLSGGLILDMVGSGSGFNFSSGNVYATINFGTAEALIGVFGTGASASLGNSSPFIGTGGLTIYGNGNAQGANILITGGVTIAGGKFTVGSTNGINTNNQLTIDKAGTLQFSNQSQQFLGLSGEGLINAISGSGTLTLDGLTGTGTTTFSGLIQNGGGTVSLTKNGASTQVLTGTNTNTGTTTINGGTLRLDFSAADAPVNNILNNSTNTSALVLGGGRLDVVGAGGATNSQQFNGLTLNGGNSSITVSSGPGGTANVSLGSTLTRNIGGTVNFAPAASGSISTAATTTLTNGVLSASASNPTAFATVNGTDWATVSGGVIGALSAYTTGNANYTAANNVDVTAGDSVAGSTVNTLRFNSAATDLTLSGVNTVNTGGILVTAASTGSSINGGTLRSNTGNELVIVNNGGLTVGSVIANGAAASVLTLSGSGTTTLDAANTFTGNAYINSGTVVVNNAAAFGTTGGTLNLNGGTLQSGSTVTLNAKAIALNRNFTIGGGNALTLSGVLTNNSSSNTLTVNNSAATALTGGVVLSSTLNVAGSGNLTTSGVISSTGGLTYSGTGTMTLANVASTYTGVTRVNNGTVSVGTLGAGGAASGIGQSTNAAANVVLDGGTLRYTGATASTDRLFSVGGSGGTLDASGIGAVTFSNAGAIGFANTPGTRTLTLGGTNTGANTLNPIIGDHLGLYATSLSKTGAGRWVLGGVNTYTGNTSIDNGTLALGSGGAINANSAITVAAGAIFDTTAQSYTFSTVKTTTIGVNATGAGLINAAAVTFSNAKLVLDFGSTSSLLASYTILVKSGAVGDFQNVSAIGTSVSGSFLDAGSGNWTLTAGGYDLTFSQSLGTLTASAVPEPATYAMIFGALALTGAVARRRSVRC